MIQVPVKAAWAAAFVIAILLAACWQLTLGIAACRHELAAGRREIAAYELGRSAERARNPAARYMDAGKPYCYEAETYYPVRKSGRLFRITR